MVTSLLLFFMLLNQVITRGGQPGYKAPTRLIQFIGFTPTKYQHSHILPNCFWDEKIQPIQFFKDC